MKERPILFSAPMVRAILEGRKTMTRRVVRPQPEIGVDWLEVGGGVDWPCSILPDGTHVALHCKFGQVGDRLWVRETWSPIGWNYRHNNCVSVQYRADDEVIDHHPEDCPYFSIDKKSKWRPSIFMPRWASRITLEITSVRVEKLNEIGMVDSASEGCPILEGTEYATPRCWFKALWESINGEGSWAKNEWVWVVGFKRVEGGAK